MIAKVDVVHPAKQLKITKYVAKRYELK